MKKIILMLSLAGCTYIAKAQFGITVGVNSSKYDYISERKPLTAFNFGFLYRLPIIGPLHIQPELLYTAKGAKVKPTAANTGVVEYKNTFNYGNINLPLIFSQPMTDKIKVDVGAGPYGGILFSAVYRAKMNNGATIKDTFDIGSDVDDDFKDFDYGVNFLGGLSYKQAGLHFKYDLGLANLSPETLVGYPPFKNRSMSLNFTWSF